MRAIVCRDFAGPDALVVGDLPEPTPAPHEIVLQVEAAAVSFMDRLMVSGAYQMRPQLPFAPGTDAAGVVTSVGEHVSAFAVGDRVVGSAWFGAFAEKMAIPAGRCAKVPEDIPLTTAATIPYAYVTAWHAFVDRAPVRAGETVVVTGAGGGAGLAAVDVANALGGRVIGVVGSAQKVVHVELAGAASVLVGPDIRDPIKELTDGRGADVCFETVGGDLFLTMGRLMARGGRLMPIGFASGDIPKLAMNLPLLKGYGVVGVFTGAWADEEPQAMGEALRQILDLMGDGSLAPRVHEVMPLENAADAMAAIAARDVIGRIVLTPR
ncbi:MAG: NADPH:quinone oxidoreductase family protein [Pseudomonadota bacterium]